MAHLGLLLGKDERDAGAVPSGASRAPHPVRVAGVVGRRIEVDHVRDVVEVEAAGRDIGRNERRDPAGLELGEGPFARTLVHVSVHRDGLDLVAPKSVDEPDRRLAWSERRRGEPVVVSEHLDEGLHLVLGRDPHEPVVRLAALDLARKLCVEAARIVRVRARELGNLAVERGREEHRLALARKPADDRVDLGLKAHVQHPIRLVEDEDADAVEVHEAAVRKILEPARRRDEDVRVLRGLPCADTEVPPYTAVTLRPVGAPNGLELLRHLCRELSCRDEDEGRGTGVPGVEALDDRRANASVLPEPVGDLARTSFPAKASGMTSDWIENGVWIDRRARAATAGSDTPRSENDSFDMWFSFSSVRDSPASKPPKKKREAHLTGSAGCRPCCTR